MTLRQKLNDYGRKILYCGTAVLIAATGYISAAQAQENVDQILAKKTYSVLHKMNSALAGLEEECGRNLQAIAQFEKLKDGKSSPEFAKKIKLNTLCFYAFAKAWDIHAGIQYVCDDAKEKLKDRPAKDAGLSGLVSECDKYFNFFDQHTPEGLFNPNYIGELKKGVKTKSKPNSKPERTGSA